MLSWVDLLYLLLLLLSIPYGLLLNSLTNPAVKQHMCFCAGATITLSLNGIMGSTHSCITICGSYVISKLLMRSRCLPVVSFVFVFGYLLFYRTCTMFGLPQPPKHSNAVQLLVTLRMISLSFQIHDLNNKKVRTNVITPINSVTTIPSIGKNSRSNNSNSSSSNSNGHLNNGLKPAINDVEVTFFDFLAYGYSYIGLLTGPFYTYTTFNQMINRTTCTNKCLLWPTLKNLKMIPFLATVYYILKEIFPLHHLYEPKFLEESSFFYCLYVITFTSMWFRWRFYIGWLLAQSSCISCGLGAYPVSTNPKPGAGPSTIDTVAKIITPETSKKKVVDLDDSQHGFSAFIMNHTEVDRKDAGAGTDEKGKDENGGVKQVSKREAADEEGIWNFESIHNIDIVEVELGFTMKNLMRRWNMSVQWWMSEHVHKRLPFRSYYLKLLVTLAISAFWHGIHAGYYLSFFSALLMVFAQAGVGRCLPAAFDSGSGGYRWVCWFFLFRYIDYIAIPFMLLKWDIVVKVWARMWFYGHVMVIAFISIALIMSAIKNKKKNKEDMM